MAKEILRLRAKEVMCFGHAPQLDLMIAHLIGTQRAFTALKKAAVACLEHSATHAKWELLWLVTPKMLRQLAE
jgi:phosphohistidine phosphatase SixA